MTHNLLMRIAESAPTHLAYAAGLIDGEGCITILRRAPSAKNQQRSASCQLAVIVAMGDPGPVDFLQRCFPASRTQRTDRRTDYCVHRWATCSRKAADFLDAVLPYLQGKRRQAEKAIEFQQFKDQVGRQGRRGVEESVATDYEKRYAEIMKHHQGHGKVGRPRTRPL